MGRGRPCPGVTLGGFSAASIALQETVGNPFFPPFFHARLATSPRLLLPSPPLPSPPLRLPPLGRAFLHSTLRGPQQSVRIFLQPSIEPWIRPPFLPSIDLLDHWKT